jgi:phage gpG-like protein
VGLVISGLDENFNKLSDRLVTSARTALKDASAGVIKAIKQNFDERGSRGGRLEWEPVPISWLRRRVTWPADPSQQGAYIANHDPLIDTGALRGSFVFESGETGSGNIEGAIESTAGYAEDHELGIPEKIRARPFMWITDDDYLNTEELLIESLKRSFN